MVLAAAAVSSLSTHVFDRNCRSSWRLLLTRRRFPRRSFTDCFVHLRGTERAIMDTPTLPASKYGPTGHSKRAVQRSYLLGLDRTGQRSRDGPCSRSRAPGPACCPAGTRGQGGLPGAPEPSRRGPSNHRCGGEQRRERHGSVSLCTHLVLLCRASQVWCVPKTRTYCPPEMESRVPDLFFSETP